MSDPGSVIGRISEVANELDKISKAVHTATDLLDAAEEAWDSVLDDVTKTLEEEYEEAGRKSVPEHTALSAARRQNRVAYQNFRRAKRLVDRLDKQRQAKSSALSGWQTELNALRDEMRALAGAGRQ